MRGRTSKASATIIIPVYKESDLLPSLLERLTQDDYKGREIIVVIDEPTEKSIQLSKGYRDVHFIFHDERCGKVNALNKAAKLSHSDILLFLDGDVYIPNGGAFVETIVQEMENTDILDIKKKIFRHSLQSKMMYYEYIGFNIGSWLMARFKKGCPAISGSAFAMRRDVFESLGGFRRVVAEDLDIAMRAFVNGYRFKYTSSAMVYTRAPPDWGQWRAQRRRWALGAAMWLKEWHRELIHKSIRSPQIFIPVLLFVAPSLLLFLLNLTDPSMLLSNIFIASLMLLLVKATPHLMLIVPTIPLLSTSHGLLLADELHQESMLRTMGTMLVGFGCASLLFFGFSRKLGFEFRFSEFFGYYFVYSLVCILFLIGYLIQVASARSRFDIDWKL
ncbi:MAG: glycosyltransferase family 2 protein [Methermicoccaceae archaeon]